MSVMTNAGYFEISTDQIRWALGLSTNSTGILPSTKFISEKTNGNGIVAELQISGKGNGHGVGACQCGIIGRARNGQNYEDILKVYYKNVKITKIY